MRSSAVIDIKKISVVDSRIVARYIIRTVCYGSPSLQLKSRSFKRKSDFLKWLKEYLEPAKAIDPSFLPRPLTTEEIFGKAAVANTPAARYRERHPERVAATAANVEARTIKRASVRFMRDRDDDVLTWLEEHYGGSGGPDILAALRDLMG